jgi:hypothetical protein
VSFEAKIPIFHHVLMACPFLLSMTSSCTKGTQPLIYREQGRESKQCETTMNQDQFNASDIKRKHILRK